jgi:hypothetical protein
MPSRLREDVMITKHILVNPLSCLAGSALMAAAVALMPPLEASAQQPFKSAEEAVEALVSAARNGDRKAVLAVVGPNAIDLVSSGDDVADAAARKRALEAYDASHQIVMEGADKAVLIIGPEQWPFPIPLARKNDAWRFDTAAGREEILARRIGRNELSTIQTCLAYVDAQEEYADKGVAGSGVYAQRIVSTPGKKDGLYWPTQPGEEGSPLGELAAAASAEGYRFGQRPIPYHGYYYRVLTQQGPTAPGGTLDYVVHGRMIGGFALIAYPAQYGNSGVMTFLVNHQGIVYEKDLGPDTARLALGTVAFSPDGTWQQATDTIEPVSEVK